MINPARVRQFAYTAGKLTKADPIDAVVLTAFDRVFVPAPRDSAPPGRASRLAGAVARTLAVAERLQADTCGESALAKLSTD